MNILYIGNWALDDGLTQSTILPHLKILANNRNIEKVVFVTIERTWKNPEIELDIPKVIHIPVLSIKSLPNIINRVTDFLKIPSKLKKLCKTHDINHIICRGAPAGNYGFILHKSLKIPFDVESFEPHAMYMLEGEVWSSFDPRFIVQKYYEKKQKHFARFLITVSHNYKKQLEKEGINPDRIHVLPCTVPVDSFKFSPTKREIMRRRLNVSTDGVIGIYVGKFGDIYYEDESFKLFAEAFNYWNGKFFLIILSPDSYKYIVNKLKCFSIDLSQVHIERVNYDEVSNWLSAADFGYTPVKPTPNRLFCSPIKDGEYWSNGLPVIIPHGIGDDSEIIQKNNIGAVINITNDQSIKYGYQKIDSLITETDVRDRVAKCADFYRNQKLDQIIYDEIYG
ncbi:hypothetical protein [Fulvivirga sp.]|uniref:hypothetical protein n=1 Tax=Fulvivirga sp. TaxID=1931237 RepID=UPI0032EF77FF